MVSQDLKRRNKLALRYFLSAIAIFLLGYGGSWLSEQSIVQGLTDNEKVEVPSPTPAKTDDPRRDLPNTEEPKAREGKEYTIQSGDTISAIAEANGITFEELAEHNDIPYPYNLTAGQVIYIPEKK